MTASRAERQLKATKEELAAALEAKLRMREGLPHLYGFPLYKWQGEFFRSTNRMNLMVAANQIGKSTCNIRKCIHWATEPSLWPKLWKTKPTLFWYMYPSYETFLMEWETKWKVEFLPRGDFKTHPQYGWEEDWNLGKLKGIRFNTGVYVAFRQYSQTDIQANSVYAVFADEEMEEEIFDEVMNRLNGVSVQGYYHNVFTATVGAEIWRLAMEERGTDDEKFKTAAKWNVSLYDCLTYEDGSPSLWTEAMIQERIDSCSSEAEVQRRVFGRFVVDEKKMFPTFTRTKNMTPDHPLPKNWTIWAGVDIGSGGASGHPCAIAFLAVNPEFTKGRIFRCYRGDKQDTTAADILRIYRALRGDLKPVMQFYDWQSKDFYNIATRAGECFTPAEKDQKFGRDLLNTLFKNEMLKLHDNPECQKAANEFLSLKSTSKKSTAKDDLTDAIRFAVAKVPWCFDEAGKDEAAKEEEKAQKMRTTRERHFRGQQDDEGLGEVWDDISLSNEEYEHLGYI